MAEESCERLPIAPKVSVRRINRIDGTEAFMRMRVGTHTCNACKLVEALSDALSLIARANRLCVRDYLKKSVHLS